MKQARKARRNRDLQVAWQVRTGTPRAQRRGG